MQTHFKIMKKFFSIILCLLFALSAFACKGKEKTATRVWLLEPQSSAAETEIQSLVRGFDPDASVSFVPQQELNMRLKSAIERGEAPDVFMVYADSIPDLAEEKQIADLSMRLGTSKVETDKLSESALRACLYQGKSWAVPVFTDVYMLACNRELVATAPHMPEQLKAVCADLKEKGIGSFEKLTPEKKALLCEALIEQKGGSMLNSRRTKLAFASEEGQTALDDCVDILKSEQDEGSMGDGKAAFSILTTRERRAYMLKYPDAEVELAPLFGLDRLQTVALGISAESKDQKKAFKMLEFLHTQTDKMAELYKTYSADKKITPISPEDEAALINLKNARPTPDLCGYESLMKIYLPAAIEKAGKGLKAADALNEAAEEAASMIWKGKRE